MTRVVINAISVKEGGSLVVLNRLLESMRKARPAWCWHVVANTQVREKIAADSAITVHCFPDVDRSSWRTRLWYETQLPSFLHQIGADLFFSQTNYLPLRRLPCPALLLVQHAGHFSPAFRKMTEARMSSPLQRFGWRIKGRWVRASIRRADMVTVQTRALAEKIILETGISREKIHVVPHGPGLASSLGQPLLPLEPGKIMRIGYITKYGVQKNFSVLFRAIAKLQAAGQGVTLVLTLDEHAVENREVLQEATRLGIAACLENHGDLSSGEIEKLYRSLHVFVFPSWCESFGFPLVEAMSFGIPVLVAEVESNIEVAGERVISFPPADDERLNALLTGLMNDPEGYVSRSRASLERAASLGWEKAGEATVALLEQALIRY